MSHVQSRVTHCGALCVESATIPKDDDFSVQWEGIRMLRYLQQSITWTQPVVGKYAAAVGLEVSDYFLTSAGIWCNGLDGKKTVSKTINVYGSMEQALRDVQRWSNYREARYISLYRLNAEGENIVAKEIFRLRATPSKNTVGPIQFRDGSFPLAVLDKVLPGRPQGHA